MPLDPISLYWYGTSAEGIGKKIGKKLKKVKLPKLNPSKPKETVVVIKNPAGWFRK